MDLSGTIWLTPPVFIVAAVTLVLLLVFLIAAGFGSWYDERTRRARLSVRAGVRLPTGYGTFRGIAKSLDHREAGPLVTSTITQVSRDGSAGAYWDERGRVTVGEPLVLVLEDGQEIEVDAREPLLFGFPEMVGPAHAPGHGERPRREIVSQVYVGDGVWATGVLSAPPEARGGAYRENLGRRKLRAPRRERIELSREAPVARWAARAKAHKRGGYAALAAIAVLHGGFFRAVDAEIWAWRSSDAWSAWDYTHATFMEIPRLGFVGILGFVVAASVWYAGARRAEKQSR